MKKQSLKLFAAVLFLGLVTVLGSAVSANAQEVIKFDVNFDFSASGKEMKAGKYELKALNRANFVLRNTESDDSVLILSSFDTKKTAPENAEAIVFKRYGDTYFLNQIFARRNQSGREMLESKEERAVRKGEGETRLAKNQVKAEKISITSAK
ncbi:MAG TPA: hypothetical protein PKY59_00345 [Pyrinomonadaceae bacterium]|nr:hypothetical protein [Pyrinomonadaceae bacterium]